jgi:adenylate cyclase
MAKEIERKYLVDKSKLPKKLPKKNIIKQGYFKSKDSTIRVRISNNKAYLTIKGKTKGISRSEYEYEIPLSDAIEMHKEFCNERFIEKTRYNIEYKGNIWEVDIFEGKNKGLFMAEIEMENEEYKFEKPEWILEEVSLEGKYNNSQLAKNPFKNWK